MNSITTEMKFELFSAMTAKLTVGTIEYVGTPAQCFKDFINDLNGASKVTASPSLRRRFSIIDHEDANTMEVGTAYVLSPAKNVADLAAMHTLIENVEPQMAAELKVLVEMIEAHPDRKLGSYGQQCVPHITHPAVTDFAKQYLADHAELYPDKHP